MTTEVEAEICSICLDPLDPDTLQTIQFGCSHRFDSHCVLSWFNANPTSDTCPLCRAKVVDTSKIVISHSFLQNLTRLSYAVKSILFELSILLIQIAIFLYRARNYLFALLALLIVFNASVADAFLLGNRDTVQRTLPWNFTEIEEIVTQVIPILQEIKEIARMRCDLTHSGHLCTTTSFLFAIIVETGKILFCAFHQLCIVFKQIGWYIFQ